MQQHKSNKHVVQNKFFDSGELIYGEHNFEANCTEQNKAHSSNQRSMESSREAGQIKLKIEIGRASRVIDESIGFEAKLFHLIFVPQNIFALELILNLPAGKFSL